MQLLHVVAQNVMSTGLPRRLFKSIRRPSIIWNVTGGAVFKSPGKNHNQAAVDINNSNNELARNFFLFILLQIIVQYSGCIGCRDIRLVFPLKQFPNIAIYPFYTTP